MPDGICATAYTGSLEPNPKMLASVWTRFLKWVVFSGGCWEWAGATNGVGYGVLALGRNGPKVLAHRLAYEQWVGPIPDGLTIDHLCRNPGCVRPDHLEPVTQRVNTLRGTSPSAAQAKQTHCKRGHPFDEANTHITTTGKRNCRTCHRDYERERQRRLRERGAA